MNTGLGDVLSGDKAIQVNVGVDMKSAVILGIALLVTIVLAGIIIKKA
jgi:hypothetical protein